MYRFTYQKIHKNFGEEINNSSLIINSRRSSQEIVHVYMSIVNIVRTARGAERAIDNNGYHYYFNRKTASAKYWLCAQRKVISSLVSQEAEARRTLISNAGGTDITVNQGRQQIVKQLHFRLRSIIKRVEDVDI